MTILISLRSAFSPPPAPASPFASLAEASLGVLALCRGTAHQLKKSKEVRGLPDDIPDTTIDILRSAGAAHKAVTCDHTGVLEGRSTTPPSSDNVVRPSTPSNAALSEVHPSPAVEGRTSPNAFVVSDIPLEANEA